MARRGDLWLLVGVTFLVLVAATFTAFSPWHESFATHEFMFEHGSLHVNDAGRSHGGFEYAAEYAVSFHGYRWLDRSPSGGLVPVYFTGDNVVLGLTLDVGLGDVLQIHELSLTVSYDNLRRALILESREARIVAELVEVDKVWNGAWDGYYIASWGADAPPEEMRGEISPEIFGLPAHYYVELRLRVFVSSLTE
ncbi:MAG: hypothetical protein QXU73_07210 [Thermoplasmata archaeon]